MNGTNVMGHEDGGRLSGWRSWLPSRGNVLFTLLMVGGLFYAVRSGVIVSAGRPERSAASTDTIAYQGRLADSGGEPLEGSFEIRFRLYSQAIGGSHLWSETWSGGNEILVDDGLFNVLLGSLTPIPQNVFEGNGTLWLGVKVDTDAEMVPRVQLGSVPFASVAATVPDRAIESRHALLSVGHFAAIIPGGFMVLTPSFQDVPGTTIPLNLETDLTYLVYVTAFLDINNTQGRVQLFVDGIAQPGMAVLGSSSAVNGSVSQSYLVHLDAGPHTLVLKAFRGASGSANIYQGDSTITYFAVSQ